MRRWPVRKRYPYRRRERMGPKTIPGRSCRTWAWDSKKKLRELIGALGARLSDDVIHNLLLHPDLETQVFRKYFSPKWKDFAAHKDVENMIEASLGAAVWVTGM
ncbi:hypothetical protein Adt_03088 [Abeliophyllum distichum]|uniref:Uncharacterized protein n=1 Tax=Abeliophyllum distichum TaxID=126358 RepID=A0ABD1VXW3_9LAMI